MAHKLIASSLEFCGLEYRIRKPLIAISAYKIVQTGPKIHAGGAMAGSIQLLAFISPTNQIAPAAAVIVQEYSISHTIKRFAIQNS